MRFSGMKLALVTGSVFITGCAVVTSPVGNGGLYTGVQGPLEVGSETGSSKKGESCAQNILGLVAMGDASIAAAKDNGGITRVSSVDHDSLSVLGLFSRFCTQVSGE
jgi:hypothetical protein